MSRFCSRLMLGMLLAGVVLAWSGQAAAQGGCATEGYRVVGRRWDAVLRMGWELRQDCAHPEWPARSVAVASMGQGGGGPQTEVEQVRSQIVQPLLVHAGEQVRLWMQDATVRIEMNGVVEQSARIGERVVVRITRQTDDQGLTVERITATVRGAGDVEMDR